MLTAAIMQPTYLPWIGYFDLIDQVDKFVFLDNVQVVKRSWGTRNRIKTVQGELYLTVPISKTKSRDETMFCQAIIDYKQPWQKRHLRSIQLAYKKTPYFDKVYPFIEKIIGNNSVILSEFNINIIKNISFEIGICKEFITASELQNINGRKDTLLVSICKAIGCDYYLSPRGSAVYIENNSPGGEFIKEGIQLYYQNYEHPVYNQLYGNFMPYMTIIDLLFNHGFEKSLEIIRSGRREPIDYSSFRRDVLNVT